MKDIEDTNDELFEQITSYLTMRLGKIYYENKEYKECIEKEEEQYEKLSKNLPAGKQEQLDAYLDATSRTAVVIGRLAYQQGMKDLFSFYKELSCKR